MCHCFYNLEFFGLAKYWGGGNCPPCPPPPPVPTAMERHYNFHHRGTSRYKITVIKPCMAIIRPFLTPLGTEARNCRTVQIENITAS